MTTAESTTPHPAHPGVLHADLDAFFAAVEVLDDPALEGRAVIVGGTGPRAVVATCSYQARVHGVGSAMPMGKALRLCPDAVVVEPRKQRYAELSAEVFAVFEQYAEVVEAVSIDEAYLDVSEWLARHGGLDGPQQLVADLRQAVRARTGLAVSVGLAPTKSAAKLASEAAKPDGARVVRPGAVAAFLAGHPVRALPGVGPATAARLVDRGIETVGQLALQQTDGLADVLGATRSRQLVEMARGIDQRAVSPRGARKQLSAERTFDTDLPAGPRLQRQLEEVIDRLLQRVARDGRAGRTVTLKLRYADFSTHTRSRTLDGATMQRRVIRDAAVGLLAEQPLAGPLRLIGVGLSNLVEDAGADGQLVFDFGADPGTGQLGSVTAADGGSGRARVVHAELGEGTLVGRQRDRVQVVFDRLPAGALDVAAALVEPVD